MLQPPGFMNNLKLFPVYREIFAPVLFSPLLPSMSAANSRLGKCPLSQMVKPFASVEGRKLHGAKIILYTDLITIFLMHSLDITFINKILHYFFHGNIAKSHC